MKPKSILLTVVGNVGSGKTTLVPILQKAFGASTLDADMLFQTENPFRDEFLADMRRWALVNELWLTLERAKLLRNHLEEHKNPLTIIDSGLLMSWVYAYSHFLAGKMTLPEWELYDQLYHELTKKFKNELIVLNLRYSLPTLRKRIEKRGREYELRLYTNDYLSQLDKGLMAFREKMSTHNISVLDITEEEFSDFEKDPCQAEKITQKVKKELGL